MRLLLPLLLLVSVTVHAAEDAPATEVAPTKWGQASFHDRRPEDFRKLAEDLLPDAPAPKPADPDKNDNHSAK